MKKPLMILLAAALCGTAAGAQEAQPEGPDMAAIMEAYQKAAEPGDEHAWLAKGAGSYSMKLRTWGDPSAPPMESTGTSERTMILGGRVLEERVSSDMMGQPFDGIARTGYDNVTGRYWNTWIDSMSTGCYMGHGERDDAGALVLRGEYDDPVSGAKVKARSVIRWQDEDTQVFEWYEDRGAGELKSMEIVYKRQP